LSLRIADVAARRTLGAACDKRVTGAGLSAHHCKPATTGLGSAADAFRHPLPMIRIGLISDTHGLLRPEAIAFLAGSDALVHAGDIGDAAILAELARLAPVTAVRGNNDHGPWAEALRETESMRFGGVLVHLLHDLAQLAIEPRSAGVRVVVAGHSHQPRVEERDGVLFVNPGSAGPRRFKLPISVGEIVIEGDAVSARTVELVLEKR
jgi:uncharacterized protein